MTRTHVLALLVVAGAACSGRPARGPAAPLRLTSADAPFELADVDDLAFRRGELLALPAGDPGRAALRLAVAGEHARRVDAALAAGRPIDAHRELLAIAELWTPAELDDPRAVADLGRFRRQAEGVFARFARSGGLAEAVAAKMMLALMDPAGAAAHRAEVDEIFAYADSLMVSTYGDGAERARPIEILEQVVAHLPCRLAVDRLAELYVERQAAIDHHFRTKGADINLIRAHGKGVLLTAWNLLRIHALAGRMTDAAPYLARTRDKLGDDAGREIRRRVAAALAGDAPIDDWLILLRTLTMAPADQRDLLAELHAGLEVARRFPRQAGALRLAGESAEELGRDALAVRLYEQALAARPGDRATAEKLADLYQARIGVLVFGGRPQAAAALLGRLEQFHRQAEARWPEQPLQHDLAAAEATMGRGLLALGELEAARTMLERSLQLRADLEALEALGTMALKRDRFAEAIGHFERALTVRSRDPAAPLTRARILRMAAEAHHATGRADLAMASARDALEELDAIDPRRLPEPQRAAMLVEMGKLFWHVGARDQALRAFDAAVDVDPEGAEVHAQVVAFLVEHDQHDRALDAYHRALGNAGIGDYHKVAMSLWLVAEARRLDREADPLAVRYLTSRAGGLWYDELARFATGRAQFAPLARRATTRSQRASLLYYAAVLDADRDPQRAEKLLEQVLATDMVLYFEYDLAKAWLSRRPTARRATSPTR